MRCEEAQELITALVDKELAGAEKLAVEDHLRACSKCQSVYRGEQALKTKVRMVAASMSAPAELRERILSHPHLFPPKAEPRGFWHGLWRPSRSPLQAAFALAVLILLVLPLLYLVRPARQTIALAALETHGKILARSLSLVKAGSQEEVKEQLVRSVERRFAPMGYDLSAMNLQVVAGLMQEVQGRKILVTLYEGQSPSLTCYTFLGTEQDAPEGAAVFFDAGKKIKFYIFSRGGINGVLHREGNVICVLVSEMPMSELLEVARSKARSA
ncbi:MAG: zf-HC2 domain-containing protein [Deltaproteobacteria bacterium]|nr:zf-HC2 domain-containing protein [Deltaproteobacteria bacterium]